MAGQGKAASAKDAPQLAKARDFFPGARFAVLQGERDRRYLGLGEEVRVFSLGEVQTDFLLIEILNELCTECMSSLAALDEACVRAEKIPEMRTRVRFLGLVAQGTKRSVARLRRRKSLRVPVFADERGRVFERLGRPLLPAVYLLQRMANQGMKVLSAEAGRPWKTGEYLRVLERNVGGGAG